MKHVGKMKNNGARIVIAYRTLPGDPASALVIGTNSLESSYHDALMSIVESDSGQQSNEISDVLAVRKFPDGSNMLAWLHTNGHLKKVPTEGVIVTPEPQTSIPLHELNQLIAEQKGLTLNELANGGVKEETSTVEEIGSISETKTVSTDSMSPSEMRSRADALYKEAAKLRKQADELDPPKKKAKAETAEA
jgi:hypothetical protein